MNMPRHKPHYTVSFSEYKWHLWILLTPIRIILHLLEAVLNAFLLKKQKKIRNFLIVIIISTFKTKLQDVVVYFTPGSTRENIFENDKYNFERDRV